MAGNGRASVKSKRNRLGQGRYAEELALDMLDSARIGHLSLCGLEGD